MIQLKLSELRSLVHDVLREYDKSIKDDESYKKSSLIVPDDVKSKINSYLDDMCL